jgi:hypothetical protein
LAQVIPLNPTTEEDHTGPGVNHKRRTEVTSLRGYARYGIAEGLINPRPDIRCSIVCAGWPSWALGAQASGWKVSRIIVKVGRWKHKLRAWFPLIPLLFYEDVECSNSISNTQPVEGSP